MNQGAIIAGGLLAAFILWLAVNNRFGVYAAIIGIGGGSGAALNVPGTGGPLAPAMPSLPVQPPGSFIPPNYPYSQTVPGG